ncbi:hypothetical protein D3C72_1759300 [compost metagenome]
MCILQIIVLRNRVLQYICGIIIIRRMYRQGWRDTVSFGIGFYLWFNFLIELIDIRRILIECRRIHTFLDQLDYELFQIDHIFLHIEQNLIQEISLREILFCVIIG